MNSSAFRACLFTLTVTFKKEAEDGCDKVDHVWAQNDQLNKLVSLKSHAQPLEVLL